MDPQQTTTEHQTTYKGDGLNDLPAYRFDGCTISRWEPTAEELTALKAGGSILLLQMNGEMPLQPVVLFATNGPGPLEPDALVALVKKVRPERYGGNVIHVEQDPARVVAIPGTVLMWQHMIAALIAYVRLINESGNGDPLRDTQLTKTAEYIMQRMKE